MVDRLSLFYYLYLMITVMVQCDLVLVRPYLL